MYDYDEDSASGSGCCCFRLLGFRPQRKRNDNESKYLLQQKGELRESWWKNKLNKVRQVTEVSTRHQPGLSGRLLWESSTDLGLTRTRKIGTSFSMIHRVMLLILMVVLIVRKMTWFLVFCRGLLLLFIITKNSGELDQEGDGFVCINFFYDSHLFALSFFS